MVNCKASNRFVHTHTTIEKFCLTVLASPIPPGIPSSLQSFASVVHCCCYRRRHIAISPSALPAHPSNTCSNLAFVPFSYCYSLTLLSQYTCTGWNTCIYRAYTHKPTQIRNTLNFHLLTFFLHGIYFLQFTAACDSWYSQNIYEICTVLYRALYTFSLYTSVVFVLSFSTLPRSLPRLNDLAPNIMNYCSKNN